MAEEPNQEPKLLSPADADEKQDGKLDHTGEGFFRRAFNRTKEAIRSVDDAITGRETFRRIEERFERHSQQNEFLFERLDEVFEKTSALNTRLGEEISSLQSEMVQQRATFEKSANEVASAAAEIRTVADEATGALSAASSKHEEMQKQASAQLTRWNSESEVLKVDLRNMQTQLAQLQNSFKQFVITALIAFAVLTAFIIYIIFARS